MPVFLKQAKLRFICVAEVISKHSSPLMFSFFSISAVKSVFCRVFSACFSRMNTFWGIPISSMYCRKSFSVEVPSGCTIDVPSPVIKIFSMVPFLQSLTASQSLSARSCSYLICPVSLFIEANPPITMASLYLFSGATAIALYFFTVRNFT